MSEPGAGQWFPDPTGRHQLRWAAAGQWTDNVVDNGVNGIDPLVAVAPPGAPAFPQPSGYPPTSYPPTPNRPAPTGSASATVAATSASRPIIGFVLTALGAVLAVFGALLPWAKVTGVIEIAISGTEDGRDGVLTLVAAIIVGLLAIAMVATRSRAVAVLVLLGSVVIGGVAAYDISNVSTSAGDVNAYGAEYVQVAVGSGLWLTLAAGGVIFLGGVVGLARR